MSLARATVCNLSATRTASGRASRRGGWAFITVIMPPPPDHPFDLALIIARNGRESKTLNGKRPGQTDAAATTTSPMSGAREIQLDTAVWRAGRRPAGRG